MTITAGFDAEFYYSTPVCNDGSNPLPLHNTGSNGIYSSTAGLNFVNTGTGEIDFSTSTAGTYLITNTIAAAGGCSQAQETFSITIDQSALVFAGNNAEVCEADGSYTLSTATMGGSTPSVLWTSTGDGSFVDATDINTTYNFGATDIGSTITLTVTTGDPGTSCGIESDSFDLTINEAPVVDAGLNDSICAGESYMLSGAQSGSTSSVSWSTSGDGTFGNGNTLTATYTPGTNDLANNSVVLTISSDDPTGPCGPASSNMTLLIHDLPVVTADATTPLCVGQQLDLTETGGEADSWIWTSTSTYDPNDEQSPSLGSVNLGSEGVYTVQGTNSMTGCSSSSNISVVVNPVPVVEASIANNDLCAFEDAELLEIGGEATEWQWTAANGFNSTEQNPVLYNATSDTSGWYYVVGSFTVSGCSSIDSVNVNINPLPIVSYTVDDADTAICIGESITLTGTGNASSYSWDNGINDGTAFSPAMTTVYTVVGEDANACKDSVSVEVTVYELPPVFAGNDQNVPYGSNTTINDATPTGLNYSWTPADSLVDPTVLNPTTVPLHMSNIFILEGTDPVTNCQNTDTMTISIIGGPLSVQMIENPNDSVCIGDAHSITALASGGGSTDYTYNWTSNPAAVYPDTLTLNLDTVTVTTTYYIEVEEGGVNYAYDTLTITIMPKPVITSVAVQDLTCFGDLSGEILIEATGDEPLLYSINGGTTFVNDGLFTGMAIGTDFYTAVQSSFGCISYGDTVDIIQPEPLVVHEDVIVDASCGNNNGMASVTVEGGTVPYTYTWNNADTTAVSDSLTAGTYIMTVTDFNGCTDTLSYTILDLGGGYLELDNTIEVQCFGDSTGAITVSMRDGFPSFDFYILSEGLAIDSLVASGDSVYTVQNLRSGTYILRAHEGAGCISNLEVFVGTRPELMATAEVIALNCYDDGTGIINLETTGGTAPYSYNWTGPNGYTSLLDTLLLLNIGSYNLTVTDDYGCIKEYNDIVMTQPGAPGVTIGIENEEQCYGFAEGKITAVGIGGTPPYTYKWTNGSWSEYSQIIDSLVSGTYHLLLTDAHDCLIADSNVTISDYAAIVLSDSIYYYGARAGIELTVSGGTLAYDYEWEDADGVSLSGDSKVDNLINGEYSVTVSDFYGCSVSETYEVNIPFVVPTLISPNADGYNDTWQIPSIESYSEVHIEIYNRWGNLVFSFDGSGAEYGDVSNQFDGTYNGQDLPIGSYVYIIDLKDGKEATPGTLSIVRTK